jgi:predicted transcriptional regulator of viral defense system
MPHSQFQEVMAVAEEHEGLVPASAARAAGIHPNTLVKMANRGRLERVSRGVYRVPAYPSSASQRADYWQAIAWARSSHGPRQVVISHESALALYGISDVLPSRMHITIPEKSRFQRRTLPGRIVVHHAHLVDADVTESKGIPVTTVDRTIVDVIESGRLDLASAAIDDALSDGHLSRSSVLKLRQKLKERYG